MGTPSSELVLPHRQVNAHAQVATYDIETVPANNLQLLYVPLHVLCTTPCPLDASFIKSDTSVPLRRRTTVSASMHEVASRMAVHLQEHKHVSTDTPPDATRCNLAIAASELLWAP
eukprot:4760398-Amphidinium_carterae.2